MNRRGGEEMKYNLTLFSRSALYLAPSQGACGSIGFVSEFFTPDQPA